MQVPRSSSQRLREAELVRDRLQSLSPRRLPRHGRSDSAPHPPPQPVEELGMSPWDEPDDDAVAVGGRPWGARWEPGRRGAVLLVAVAVVAAALVGLVVWHARPALQPVAAPSVPASGVSLPTPPPATVAATTASRIAVAVAGKVRHPGVVELPAGSRVIDAIHAAGGLSAGAHLGLLNLAKVLSDGEQVVVGIPGVTGSAGDASVSAPGDSGPIDLNTATLDQLDSLPGVGPSTAQKILDYRASNGAFRSVEQLQDISGIGPAKYAQIAPKVTI